MIIHVGGKLVVVMEVGCQATTGGATQATRAGLA